MANLFATSPPPRVTPSFALGETDTRFIDFSPFLAPLGDQVASIIGVQVTMRDGSTVPSSGISILESPTNNAPFAAPPWLDSAGYTVAFWVYSGVIPGNFQINVSVLTSSGRTITRSCFTSVLLSMG